MAPAPPAGHGHPTACPATFNITPYADNVLFYSTATGPAAVQWSGNEGTGEGLSFTPNGQRLMFSEYDGNPTGARRLHTINLEQLATVVAVGGKDDGWVFPDTLIGTDSHTPMVNGIGVLAWGVGGLEAESVFFGMPVSLRVPAGPPGSRHVEHRIAGADANLYLAVAAVLAALPAGVEVMTDVSSPWDAVNRSGPRGRAPVGRCRRIVSCRRRPRAVIEEVPGGGRAPFQECPTMDDRGVHRSGGRGSPVRRSGAGKI